MELRLGVTVQYFLWSVALGIILAFLYDFLRSSRRLFKTSVFGVNLEDILFFLLSSFMIFWIAYDKNNGIIRLQGFLGVFIGFWIYRRIFRDFWVRLMVIIVEILVKFFIFFLRIVLFPLKIIYCILAKPLLVIGWYSQKGMNRAESVLKTIKTRKKMIKKARTQPKKP